MNRSSNMMSVFCLSPLVFVLFFATSCSSGKSSEDSTGEAAFLKAVAAKPAATTDEKNVLYEVEELIQHLPQFTWVETPVDFTIVNYDFGQKIKNSCPAKMDDLSSHLDKDGSYTATRVASIKPSDTCDIKASTKSDVTENDKQAPVRLTKEIETSSIEVGGSPKVFADQIGFQKVERIKEVLESRPRLSEGYDVTANATVTETITLKNGQIVTISAKNTETAHSHGDNYRMISVFKITIATGDKSAVLDLFEDNSRILHAYIGSTALDRLRFSLTLSHLLAQIRR